MIFVKIDGIYMKSDEIYSLAPWWYIKQGVSDCRANHKNVLCIALKLNFLKKLKCL